MASGKSKMRPRRKHFFLILVFLLIAGGLGIVFVNGKLNQLQSKILPHASTPTATPIPGNYPFVLSTAIPNPVTGAGYEPATAQPLDHLNWCRYNSQQPRFWDYGGNANAIPNIVTDWTQIQNQLGFTLYLPKALSADACLVSVEGDLNSPSGSTFRIIYAYYQRLYTSRYLLQEQLAQGTGANLQCKMLQGSDKALETIFSDRPPTPTDPAPGLCTGQRDQTLITFQAPENVEQLTADFQAFQPGVAFLPICGCQNTSEHILRVHV